MILYKRQWITVDDMYKYASEHNLYLLAMHDGSFWTEYITNHATYDRMFRRMFRSFRYFLQDGDETVEEVTENFIEDVAFHLTLNRKKYEELYRIMLLQDEEIPVSGNVNLEEKLDKETSDTGDLTYGARVDTSQDISGARTDTLNRTESVGAKINTETDNIGAQTETSTKEVFAFNSNDYQDDVKNTRDIGTRQDSKTQNQGAQTNTNGGTDVKGSQTDNGTYNKGQQVDNRDLHGTEEYTKTIKGTDGHISVIKTVEQYKNFWNKYEFYEYIFKEICRDLLLV